MDSTYKVVNVSQLIDESRFSGLQLGVVGLCACIGLLDGADTQSIGVAAPYIAGAVGLKISSFGPIFAASQLGAAVGALTFGPLADRLGRKTMLIVAVLMFGLFTLATLSAASFSALLVTRFFAGLGLGGATPCFLTLTSDYSPRRQRGMIATIIWSAYPLGAAFGSFANAYILSHIGWHAIFQIGGFIPLVVAIVLLVALPESVQFLAARGASTRRISHLLRRMGHSVSSREVRFVVDGKTVSVSPIRGLFTDHRSVVTVLLWVIFFFAFATTNVMVMWTPTLLNANGIARADTAIVVAFFNLAGFFGMAIAGWLVDRCGATRVLFPAFVGAALSIAALGSANTLVMASAISACLGLTIGLGGAGVIALASLFYPPAIRSTGIGWSMASARFGQFVSPLLIGSLVADGLASRQILSVAAAFPSIAAIGVCVLWLNSSMSQGHVVATKLSKLRGDR